MTFEELSKSKELRSLNSTTQNMKNGFTECMIYEYHKNDLMEAQHSADIRFRSRSTLKNWASAERSRGRSLGQIQDRTSGDESPQQRFKVRKRKRDHCQDTDRWESQKHD